MMAGREDKSGGVRDGSRRLTRVGDKMKGRFGVGTKGGEKKAPGV